MMRFYQSCLAAERQISGTVRNLPDGCLRITAKYIIVVLFLHGHLNRTNFAGLYDDQVLESQLIFVFQSLHVVDLCQQMSPS